MMRDTISARIAVVGAAYRARETRIVTVIGFVLVAAAAFGAGLLASPVWQGSPLVVEHAIATDGATAESSASPVMSSAPAAGPADCAFVGSRNSDKYYPPTCSFAKRIAPENLRCFISAEDAEAKGYVRSTGC